MSLTKEQVKDVCKIQTTDCCAFLIMGGTGFECAKNTVNEPSIRARLAEKTMNAVGENCDGFKEDTSHD